MAKAQKPKGKLLSVCGMADVASACWLGSLSYAGLLGVWTDAVSTPCWNGAAFSAIIMVRRMCGKCAC